MTVFLFQKAADITEQFEKLYERATAESVDNKRSVAMLVTMVTSSRYLDQSQLSISQ